MEFNKYDFLDCLGKWCKSHNYSINLSLRIYDNNEKIMSYKELYKDINIEDKLYRFFWVVLEDKSELIIRVKPQNITKNKYIK